MPPIPIPKHLSGSQDRAILSLFVLNMPRTPEGEVARTIRTFHSRVLSYVLACIWCFLAHNMVETGDQTTRLKGINRKADGRNGAYTTIYTGVVVLQSFRESKVQYRYGLH